MARQEVIKITASQIEDTLRMCHSAFHRDLLLWAAEQKEWHGGPIHIRLDFPGGDTGGIEMRVNRGTWLGWALWKLAGRPLEAWRE